MRKLSLRTFFPILAAVLFAILSLAATRQTHVIDLPGWEKISGRQISWGEEEPVDIGTPADILLLAFNLPALLALLPLSPLTYWIDSEIALRTAWGLGAVGQWFLIGRYLDARRGLVPRWTPSRHVWLNKAIFGVTTGVGSLLVGVGVFGEASGHHSFWGVATDACFVFWGVAFVFLAFRWRSSLSWTRENVNSLGLS